jgi:SAM-dependent methyltransferase
VIRYELSNHTPSRHVAELKQIIRSRGLTDVCEIGAGANPALDTAFIDKHRLRFLAIDSSSDEIRKMPSGYGAYLADVSRHDFRSPRTFDLVFSISVGEHVTAPQTFHENIFAMLRPGGTAFHYFATLYALPFVVNRVLPERMSEVLLRTIDPRRTPEGRLAKFPARYRWCRGPTQRQIERFERIGYRVEEYVGFFGHDYTERIPIVRSLENALARGLQRYPIPALTSYAQVILARP